MASGQSSDACAFHQLSDELVVKVLELACEEPWDAVQPTRPYPLGFSEQTWVSSHSLSRLSTVCQRFRALQLGGHFQNVAWKFAASEQLGGHAVVQSGDHLRGLILDYFAGRELYRDFERSGRLLVVSVGTFSDVLSRATNLETLRLRANKSSIAGKELDIFWRLIVQLPKLRTLDITVTGLDLRSPLRGEYLCNSLVHLRLDSATISDSFLSSLLERLPALRELRLSSCSGLTHLRFKAAKLEILELQTITCGGFKISLAGPAQTIITSTMSVDAPNLTSLKGVPGVSRLDLQTPKLKILSMPRVPELRISGPNMSLSSLTLRGKWEWGEIEQFVSKHGASDLLDIGSVSWHKDSGRVPISAFLAMVPSTVASLVLGDLVSHLSLSDRCVKTIRKLRFELLKSAHFKVSESDDFDLIELIFQSCPRAREAVIDMIDLFTPISNLISKAVHLQAANPRVVFSYKEPDHFISSMHFETLAQAPEGIEFLKGQLLTADGQEADT